MRKKVPFPWTGGLRPHLHPRAPSPKDREEGDGGRVGGIYVPHLYRGFSFVTSLRHVPSDVMICLLNMILKYVIALQYRNILLQYITEMYIIAIYAYIYMYIYILKYICIYIYIYSCNIILQSNHMIRGDFPSRIYMGVSHS